MRFRAFLGTTLVMMMLKVLPSTAAWTRPLAGSGRALYRYYMSDQEPIIQEESTTLEGVSLYRSQGIFAVAKPLEWTSQDVVAYIRGILERDARQRGAKPARINSRKRSDKNRKVKVGHGGTLDPLATGVLVIGVGQGTKQLQGYLSGAKTYKAGMELGFETTTLDLEGNVTRREPFDHVTWDNVKEALPVFIGDISQIPPVYSALKKDGKKLYQLARKGEEVEIEARPVTVHRLELASHVDEEIAPHKLDILVECGGGTYVRSLVRDLGQHLGTAATMTSLERTQQGPFVLEDCLVKDEWNADSIYAAIDACQQEQ